MNIYVTRYGLRVPRLVFFAIATFVAAVLTVTMLPADSVSAAPRLAQVEGEDPEEPEGDEALERPDRVSASSTARALDKRVLITGETTETDQVFANPDGTFTAESYADPARVQDENGEWQDIDLTLEETEDGFAPKVAPVKSVFSAGGDETFVELQDVKGKDLKWGWPEELPAPEVEGNTLTYADVVENGDLVVRVLPDGFSHSIVLRAPPTESEEPFEIPIPVQLDGAKLESDEDGTLTVSAGNNELVTAPAPLMWDAAENDAGDPENLAPVEATVEKTGQETELILTPDEDMLTDPETQYPVTIDPTFTAIGGGSEWVQTTNYPNGVNGDDFLRVGTYNGGTYKARSYQTFSASSFLGKDIVSADLRLWESIAEECGTSTISVNRITDNWSASSLTWSNQPAVSSTGQADLTQAAIGAACGSGGFVYFDVKNIAQAWAGGADAHGIRIKAASETSNKSWRKYRSSYYTGSSNLHPRIGVTFNTAPAKPASMLINPSTSNGGTTYSTIMKPKISVPLADGDGGTVRAELEVKNDTGAVFYTGSTPYVASGGTATKEMSTLSDGTYTVRTRAYDGRLNSGWTSPKTFVVDSNAPAAPSISCTAGTSGTWYTTRPASSTTCDVTGSGVATFEWTKNNQPQAPVPSDSTGANGTLGTFTIPENGVFGVQVRARDLAGNLSAPTEFGFGTGDAGLITPVTGERTSSSVLVEAEGPSSASSARIEHRPARTTTTAWTTATEVTQTTSGSAWTGSVSSTGNGSFTTGKLTWDIAGESGVSAPSVRETRVCFVYTGVDQCTPARDITVVPNAFGGSFPTQAAGPGEVALFTGEFQLSETDVEVPAYSGTLTLGRSHRSMSGANTPAAEIFGPGWVADLAGPESGAPSVEIIDNTASEASITLVDPGGESWTYTHEDDTASAQRVGVYVGDAETDTDNDILELTTSGTDKFLTLYQEDGTETTWKHLGSGQWVVEEVDEPGSTGTTTYTHDSNGLVTGIYAPAPSGVTCNATTQNAGCRAFWLTYVTVSGEKRLDKVDLRIWDPEPGSDGKPTGGAGMKTITVQRYAYNSNGTLKEAWDPRLDSGGNSLKTEYDYDTIGTHTVLIEVTEPGLTPWEFEYETTAGSDHGKFRHAKRQRPSPLSGDATWTVEYDTPLSGSGLPTLTTSEVAKWGQTAAPTGAATVYGPDASGTSDKTFGTISYYDIEGRTTNTAAYGAGAWQIDSTIYDAKGNEVWSLDEGNRAAAMASFTTPGAATAAVANSLATLTTYNDEGTRVEEVRGPTRQVMLKDGSVIAGRSRSTTIYDDEADSGLVPGRPTPDPDEPPLNLPVEELTHVVDAAGDLFDEQKTQYRYDPVVSGDGDGWLLGSATRVSTKMGSSSWSTTLTRFDTEGKVVETRTPQGVAAVDGTANDTRSTKTVYYTADASASDFLCRSKPQWAGLECTSALGGQPSGTTIPVTRTNGFDYLLNATRNEETSSTVTRASIAAYDVAGRKSLEKVAVTNAPSGDQPVADVTYAYSASTGAVATLSDGTLTQSTTYDAWGRLLTQTDGTGNTATTTYDNAGRVATLNDGKGTYTYTYNGTDADGETERRGLVTKIDVGLASGPDEFKVAYDADANPYLTEYPNGIKATTEYDAEGDETSLTYADGSTPIAAFSHTLDSDSRVRVATSMASTQKYTYDDRDRLAKVEDTTAAGCETRVYTLSLDSNRTSMATSPDAGSGCTTSGATTVNSTFDGADRITTSGYTYDELGRSQVVPAVHTDQPTGGNLAIDYYANEMVAKLAQTVPDGAGTIAKTKAFTLDPAGRLSKTSDTSAAVELRKTTNHFADETDSAAWIETLTRPNASTAWTTTWARNVIGPGDDLALIEPSSGTTKMQITNLHGDVVAQLDNTTYAGFDYVAEATEYGLSRSADTTPTRTYGWLGGKRRSTDSLGGFTLMGVRLYNPATGRFLSMDPVNGGNDNTYTYPADPINMTDLDGEWGVPKWAKKAGKHLKKNWKTYATVASIAVPGLGWAGASYRAYKIVKAARAGKGMSGGLKAGRWASKIAGKKWVGKGSRKMSNGGGRISKDGLRQYRKPQYKRKQGFKQSNFERRGANSGRWTDNHHVRIGRYMGRHRR